MIDLSKAIREITKEYGEKASRLLEETAELAAKEAVEELKATSPKNMGKYHKGWRIKRDLTKAGKPKLTVYSFKYSGLTHLLEHGHATSGGGRTRAFSHIKPAEDNAVKRFEQELRSKL